MSRAQIFALIGIAAVLVVVIAAVVAIDSPAEARAKKFDRTRLSDLKAIDRGIESYVLENAELPEELTDLETERIYTPTSLTDPETDTLYGYERTGEWTYELCARFGADYQPEEYRTRGHYGGPWIYDTPDIFYGAGSPSLDEVRTYTERDWYYEPGKWCFDRSVEDVIPNVDFSSGAGETETVSAGFRLTHRVTFDIGRNVDDVSFELINAPEGMHTRVVTNNSATVYWRTDSEDVGTHEVQMELSTKWGEAQSSFTVVVTE